MFSERHVKDLFYTYRVAFVQGEAERYVQGRSEFFGLKPYQSPFIVFMCREPSQILPRHQQTADLDFLFCKQATVTVV